MKCKTHSRCIAKLLPLVIFCALPVTALWHLHALGATLHNTNPEPVSRHQAQQGVPLVDTPVKYGPKPINFQLNGRLYRAVHYLSEWQPSSKQWVVVSPNLTEVNEVDAPGFGIDGITAVAHSSHTWYVGTLAGRVEVKFSPATSSNHWLIRTQGLPERTVTALAINPNDPAGQFAITGFGGYGPATPDTPGHVYVTFDTGRHWLDISGDLPDEPVQAIRLMNLTQDTTTPKGSQGITMPNEITQDTNPSNEVTTQSATSAAPTPWLEVQMASKWYHMIGNGDWQSTP